MKDFANELRRHREAKGISLLEISSATKIHLKYLQAIEEGDYSFLPQPYVRAFLCNYAKTVGLDADETIRRYHSALQAMEQITESAQPEQKTQKDFAPIEKDPPSLLTGVLTSLWLSLRTFLREYATGRKLVPVAGVIILVGAVVLVANMTKTLETESTPETPFEQIIKEKERSSSGELSRSTGKSDAAYGSIGIRDSLVLEGRAREEVWMLISIDDQQSAEYLFPPNISRRWRAKEKFLLTLGNAGGMSLRLNGKDLGTLGRSGAVLRNILITRDGVQK